MQLNQYQLDVLKARYLLPTENSWEDLAKRTSEHVVRAEPESKQHEWKELFFEYINNGYFIPAGRIMYGSGRKIGALLNCFCLGMEDSRHSIAKFLHDMYLISTGLGGIGYNVSDIRPRGEAIQGQIGLAAGVVSEIKKVDIIGEQVTAGGGRRCALLAGLSIYHPDILEFLSAKLDLKTITHHNISVMIDNEFLDMVKKNKKMKFEYKNVEYQLYEVKTDSDLYLVMSKDPSLVKEIFEAQYRKNYEEKIESIKPKKITARNIWDMIIDNSVKSGEPGLLNIDNINRNFAPGYFEKFSCTNPCLVGSSQIWIKCDIPAKGYCTPTTLKEVVEKFEKDKFQTLSYNIKTGIREFKKITNAFLTKKNVRVIMVDFNIDGYGTYWPKGRITCTPDHKIYTTNRGYVEAQYLTVSDEFISYNPHIKFTLEKIICSDELQDVYDITVEDNHNFFTSEVLVSNCGEALLPAFGDCDLGSINLSEMYDESTHDVNWSLLAKSISVGVRFLDDVLSVNNYPIHETKTAAESSRRIGLGVVGLHYLLIKLGHRYGSKKCIEFIERLFATIRNEAFEASADIAIEKGSFNKFDDELYFKNDFINSLPPRLIKKIKKTGIRNSVCLSIAPTGTMSMIAGTSSSIEPMFAPIYKRRYRSGAAKREEIVMDKLFAQFLIEGKDLSNFIGAHEITPEEHLAVQAAVQKFVDQSLAKTINLPEDFTPDQLSEILLEYMPYLKGCTVYRQGSRGEEPLEFVDINQIDKEELLKVANIYTREIKCNKGTCEW